MRRSDMSPATRWFLVIFGYFLFCCLFKYFFQLYWGITDSELSLDWILTGKSVRGSRDVLHPPQAVYPLNSHSTPHPLYRHFSHCVTCIMVIFACLIFARFKFLNWLIFVSQGAHWGLGFMPPLWLGTNARTSREFNFKGTRSDQLMLLEQLVEKATAPHSSTLAWKIPGMEEPGRLKSTGSLRVGHDWATSLSLFTFRHWRRTWQPTPVFLPGESQGRGSLVGCRLQGRTESDTTEAT